MAPVLVEHRLVERFIGKSISFVKEVFRIAYISARPYHPVTPTCSPNNTVTMYILLLKYKSTNASCAIMYRVLCSRSGNQTPQDHCVTDKERCYCSLCLQQLSPLGLFRLLSPHVDMKMWLLRCTKAR